MALPEPATSFGSDAAAAFRADLAHWLETNAPSAWRERAPDLPADEAAAIKREWDRTLFEGGYAGLTWPPQFGGRGAGEVEEYIFYEECARAQAPEGLGRVGRLMVAPTLFAHGTQDQQDRYLPGILSGAEIWCQGFSEPGAGSDLAAVSTVARRDGDGYRVTGQKVWTSFAHYSDRCLLLARTGDSGARHRNLAMLAVDMHAPGVLVRPIRQISGDAEFNEVFLDDVPVPAADLIGPEGEGWSVAMTVLVNERGAGEAATRFIELRELAHLLVGHCAASSDEGALREGMRHLADVEALRWQVMRGIEAGIQGLPGGEATMSVLKLYWSELLQEMTSFGLSLSCPQHEAAWRYRYLDARSATIAGGSSEIQRNIIAQRVLGLPRSR